MIIRANNKDIQVKSVLGEKIKRNGNSYPALRFEFENEITTDDVTALLSGSFEIVDNNNNVIGTYEGYNTKGSISFVIGKITTADEHVVELEEANSTLQQNLEATTQNLENTTQELNVTTQNLKTVTEEKNQISEALNIILGGSAE